MVALIRRSLSKQTLVARIHKSLERSPDRIRKGSILVDDSKAYPPGDIMKINKWWKGDSQFSGSIKEVLSFL